MACLCFRCQDAHSSVDTAAQAAVPSDQYNPHRAVRHELPLNYGRGFQTGLPPELKEFTLTYQYKWVEGLLARLEYRRDWSDRSFFQRGATPGASNHQDTVALGVVAFFGPKR